MVLNLIIVTDEAGQYDAMRAASEAGREHPCRILGVIIRRPDAGSRLDAEIHTGEAGPSQTVLLRMYGDAGPARRLGGQAAARAGHAGADVVAGRGPGHARPPTRWACWRSAGSPTRPRRRRRGTR